MMIIKGTSYSGSASCRFDRLADQSGREPRCAWSRRPISTCGRAPRGFDPNDPNEEQLTKRQRPRGIHHRLFTGTMAVQIAKAAEDRAEDAVDTGPGRDCAKTSSKLGGPATGAGGDGGESYTPDHSANAQVLHEGRRIFKEQGGGLLRSPPRKL